MRTWWLTFDGAVPVSSCFVSQQTRFHHFTKCPSLNIHDSTAQNNVLHFITQIYKTSQLLLNVFSAGHGLLETVLATSYDFSYTCVLFLVSAAVEITLVETKCSVVETLLYTVSGADTGAAWCQVFLPYGEKKKEKKEQEHQTLPLQVSFLRCPRFTKLHAFFFKYHFWVLLSCSQSL